MAPLSRQPSPRAAPANGSTRGGGTTVWLTGLPGSGKTAIARALAHSLAQDAIAAYVLDGDDLRAHLSCDLGFTPEDRAESVRRAGHVARLFADAGFVAIVALVSPYEQDRRAVRELHARDGLVLLEVFVDAPLAVCEQRDPKGHYRRARNGQLHGFTGVDAPYERPRRPDVYVPSATMPVTEAVSTVRRAMPAVAGGLAEIRRAS
jgi:adenylyl-sulfate kinase